MRLIDLPLWLLLAACFCTCAADAPVAEAEQPTAEGVIRRAVAVHGMEDLNGVDMAFRFRERDYTIRLDGGTYQYTRSFTDSTGALVRDELRNDGLTRYRDGEAVSLTPKDSAAYAESVNSVRYFFLLPYGLLDPAVNAELLDTTVLGGNVYDRIRVTFDRIGGGSDYEDVYHYFFDRESGELDYLAYTFLADDGGIRFRKAVNQRRVGGVLTQDYVNYGLDGNDRDIEHAAARYRAGELPELSRIENTSVRIERAGR